MAKYAKDDCRNHGGPIKSASGTFDFIVESNKVTRHEKRMAKHFKNGLRKNTRGFILGYNKTTFDRMMASK